MKKLLIFFLSIVLLVFSVPSYALDIDQDGNNAVDVLYGGTNTSTAAGARTNLGLGTDDSFTIGKITVSNSATRPPLNLSERSTAPSAPVSGDIYLDDGTNTTSGNPGLRRWTGAAWEDMDVFSAATETHSGVVELATTAEAVTGTDTERAVTPAGLTARMAAPGAIGGTTAVPSLTLTQSIFTDGTDSSIIKHVQEPGLGGRLTIGLDETARTLVICDEGDKATDLGLGAKVTPTLYIMTASGTEGIRMQYDTLSLNGGSAIHYPNSLIANTYAFTTSVDRSSGDAWSFVSNASIELTDTDGEQSWLYIEPKINQSGTAGYNGIKIKVTETALGSAAAATDSLSNNLILAGTSSSPALFKVKNDGTVSAQNVSTYGTVYIPAGSMQPTDTNGAVKGYYEYPTNDKMRVYLAFDGATEQFAGVSFPMPEDWNRGTIKAKFFWSSATGSTAGDTVEWELTAGAVSNDDAIDAAYGTSQIVSDTLLADNGADDQLTAATPAITVGGTPALHDMIDFKVSRNVGGTDSMTESAYLYGILIQYTKNNSVAAW